jgi:pseudaminic acid biosynthesis-associated methylase
MSDTPQTEFWKNDFGREYTDRNTYAPENLNDFYTKTWGISREELNRQFLEELKRDIRILEVGCNVGQQLHHLQIQGFKNLFGIEIQPYAVLKSKQLYPDINIILGSGADIPFKDNWFDLIFTSGVLIHIHPLSLPPIIQEIYRCTKKYIWGFEYYSDTLTEIPYRGHDGYLWKQNFCGRYLDLYPGLKLLKEKRIKYLHQENNVDQMFLLEK